MKIYEYYYYYVVETLRDDTNPFRYSTKKRNYSKHPLVFHTITIQWSVDRFSNE